MKNYFKLPNKYIDDNAINLEIISQLCKRKSIDGFWEGHINGLLYFSNISMDRNYRNKKHALQYLRSIGANIDNDYVSIYVDAIFDANEDGNHINYTKIPCDAYDYIDDISLYKYYVFMVHAIGFSNGCYRNSLANISKKVGFSEPSIIKYNNLLMNCGLIYYVNSGDLYSKYNNIAISSINFYGVSLSDCQYELDNWLTANKDNYGIDAISSDKKYDSSKLKSANMIIYHYAKRESLTEEQYNKLMDAYGVVLGSVEYDYTDSKVKDEKINYLIDRTKGGNYELDYDMARDIIDGKIKIGDCFKG